MKRKKMNKIQDMRKQTGSYIQYRSNLEKKQELLNELKIINNKIKQYVKNQ